MSNKARFLAACIDAFSDDGYDPNETARALQLPSLSMQTRKEALAYFDERCKREESHGRSR